MSDKKDFKNWFDNVFWYHYKWWFLGAVFLIALIVFIAVESAGNEDYDMTVIFAQDGDVSEQQAQIVLDAISDSVGDLNGDGKTLLNYQSVNFSGEVSQGFTMQDRLILYMTDEECALFIIENEASANYCAMGYFEDRLSDYGISTPEDDPYRISLADSSAISDAGLADYDYYAQIIDWTTVNKGSQETTDAAISAINALLSN